MPGKIDSVGIKKLLAENTGVAASKWSRWTKYKVGSPSDMKPPKDKSLSFCKGIKFGEHFPHLLGVWVRLYGAPSDQAVTGVAVFEKDGIVLDILGITETKNDCGAPEPGRLRDPEGWESWYGHACENGLDKDDDPPAAKSNAKQIAYNVITQIGYVESSHPSLLWWTHVGDVGKSGKQLAEELRQLFITFYKEDFIQKDCCKDKKPTKKNKYCPTCGGPLGNRNPFGNPHQGRVENAIRDLHLGCIDSIMGDCRRDDGRDLDDYFKEKGWEFWHGPGVTGSLVEINQFDEYMKSDPCWGDDQHNYYGGISEGTVAFA